MIVVDSSVWIDYFNGTETRETEILNALLDTEPIVIGDLILAEVMQGFRYEREARPSRRWMSSSSNLWWDTILLWLAPATAVCSARAASLFAKPST